MEHITGKGVKVFGFESNGNKFLISKGIVLDYVQCHEGVMELTISCEGLLRIVKITRGMIIEEHPG